jgi:hypothetical protein
VPGGGLGRSLENDKGHLAVPLDSVGLAACHHHLGPARLLPRVSKAPCGIIGNSNTGTEIVNGRRARCRL